MNEFIEKLIGRLEVNSFPLTFNFETESYLKYNKVKEIVNELAEEHNDRTMIDGEYCWQSCCATEHCKECNRLGNGDIDYYENWDGLYTEKEMDFKIKVEPFSWNDNFSEVALEDFSMIQKNLSYCTCQSIGMALAKLALLEEQGCKVGE